MKKGRYNRDGKVGLDIEDENRAILRAANSRRPDLSANKLTSLSRTKDFAKYFSRKSRQLADLQKSHDEKLNRLRAVNKSLNSVDVRSIHSIASESQWSTTNRDDYKPLPISDVQLRL